MLILYVNDANLEKDASKKLGVPALQYTSINCQYLEVSYLRGPKQDRGDFRLNNNIHVHLVAFMIAGGIVMKH